MDDSSDKQHSSIAISAQLFSLLQRCSHIEGREIDEILSSLLTPYLERYANDTLEQWEEVRDLQDREKILQDFERNDNFNPNEIPFNSQIFGLRRKLDDLDREIASNHTPRPDLEQLRFTLVEELNYAEKDALQKQRDEYLALSERWKSVCVKIPL